MPVELDNEIALVSLAQAGFTQSFGILVSRYEHQIYVIIRAIMKHPEDAEDLLQATFFKAYENIRRFDGKSRFIIWLTRIAVSEALTRLRMGNSPHWVPFDELAGGCGSATELRNVRNWRPDIEGSFNRTQMLTILTRSLGQLEIPLRVVFGLRDIGGFSGEETASMLGVNVAVIKALSMCARLKLRQDLSVWFEDRPVLTSG